MKPKIYITRRLPDQIVLKLEEDFQIFFWEDEDFGILEQAIEKADREFRKTGYFEA